MDTDEFSSSFEELTAKIQEDISTLAMSIENRDLNIDEITQSINDLNIMLDNVLVSCDNPNLYSQFANLKEQINEMVDNYISELENEVNEEESQLGEVPEDGLITDNDQNANNTELNKSNDQNEDLENDLPPGNQNEPNSAEDSMLKIQCHMIELAKLIENKETPIEEILEKSNILNSEIGEAIIQSYDQNEKDKLSYLRNEVNDYVDKFITTTSEILEHPTSSESDTEKNTLNENNEEKIISENQIKVEENKLDSIDDGYDNVKSNIESLIRSLISECDIEDIKNQCDSVNSAIDDYINKSDDTNRCMELANLKEEINRQVDSYVTAYESALSSEAQSDGVELSTALSDEERVEPAEGSSSVVSRDLDLSGVEGSSLESDIQSLLAALEEGDSDRVEEISNLAASVNASLDNAIVNSEDPSEAASLSAVKDDVNKRVDEFLSSVERDLSGIAVEEEEEASPAEGESALVEDVAVAEKAAEEAAAKLAEAAAAKESEEKAAEEKRLAEEQAAKEAEAQRAADEKAAAEKAAEEKRLAEEQAAKEAEAQRAADEKAAAEKAAEEKRLAEEQAAKEAEAQRAADEKAAAEKAAEEKRLAEEQAAKEAEPQMISEISQQIHDKITQDAVQENLPSTIETDKESKKPHKTTKRKRKVSKTKKSEEPIPQRTQILMASTALAGVVAAGIYLYRHNQKK
ncbi:hypothetical protein TVAG_420470 [Trichomonas vaginalis G3]|uniref:Uncharacterized protein n=1 Tax=Trichomonas vaginalis (strain ATCC PRA-98 / G3) TaxID=412133 RepID=A2ED70_TRIV3|nr:hypothetical protein TVAGG3_0425150 [Trichomonas vaginalis G3]EAY09425.1 hypothetical protein TVAG_420470 [Trichomonas vaginalis G3]KAI5536346.1 hypothetical protein TVAGG3_0425150 [Trichomonas vaginalis G3]|eukprot:XP_001321648.1 hypothetical protein [Trichomonas vaginalis G3]